MSQPKNRLIQKINYDRQMQEIIKDFEDRKNQPSLLLHSCCAPCSSSVIKRLAPFFKLKVFYYNPNIDTPEEYNKRAEYQQKLIKIYNEEKIAKTPIEIFRLNHCEKDYTEVSEGLGAYSEGGLRCMRCYYLRLRKTFNLAVEMNYDFFCTTLTVSPHKNPKRINQIGFYLGNAKTRWLPNDFKKRNGYIESISLSKEFNLYRQNYCGCKYSHQK